MINPKNVLTNEWESYLLDRGVSKDLVLEYLHYINKITSNDLPVIFEVEHLSVLIGIKHVVINKMVHKQSDYYREFEIPKRSGGYRLIAAPYPSLLMCQDWIYQNILKSRKLHYTAHAYRPKKSIITNAKAHLKTTALLKMDMENFFPSIPFNWVINFFSKLGYPNNVAYTLASLCCLSGGLPQGASTSPALSNILLVVLDRRLYYLSKKFNLNYTRYADDVAFSGSYIPHKFIGLVTSIIIDFGLNVNENKTKLLIGDKQKIVTGLSVHGESIAVPRKSKREIKQAIHYIRKYGLVSHISKLKIKNPNYILSLEGKLRFWIQVEPDNKFAKDSLDFIVKYKFN